jgi:hypothetical protein
MAVDSLQARQLDDAQNRELVASFLLAEFHTLQERARSSEQIHASRVNFFALGVAAASAGLLAAASLQASDTVQQGGIVLLAVLLGLGLLILQQRVSATLAVVDLLRMAGRVRCWFADLAPEAIPYFASIPADNRPAFTTPFWLLRGGEVIVVALNALLTAGLVFLTVDQAFGQAWVAGLVGLVMGPAAWIFQQHYVEERMIQADCTGFQGREARFPYWKYEARFQAAQEGGQAASGSVARGLVSRA